LNDANGKITLTFSLIKDLIILAVMVGGVILSMGAMPQKIKEEMRADSEKKYVSKETFNVYAESIKDMKRKIDKLYEWHMRP
jgi:hypothetical protein